MHEKILGNAFTRTLPCFGLNWQTFEWSAGFCPHATCKIGLLRGNKNLTRGFFDNWPRKRQVSCSAERVHSYHNATTKVKWQYYECAVGIICIIINLNISNFCYVYTYIDDIFDLLSIPSMSRVKETKYRNNG